MMENLTKHKIYKDVLADHPDIYDGLEVDPATQLLLNQFFLLSRINSRNEDRFIWLYRRNLNQRYPVYRDERDMWAAYKAKGWLDDNKQLITEIYSGNTTSQNTLKEDIIAEVKRIMNGTSKETDNGTSDTTSSTTAEGDTKTDTTDTFSDKTDAKNRAFSFNFPESNYQGGVIPYDLENDPTVEFIDQQADTIGRNQVNHNGESTQKEHDEASTDGNSKTDTTGEKNGTTTQDDTTNDSTTKDATNSGKGTQDYKKTSDSIGRFSIDIVKELFPLVQESDFFKRFTGHLLRCFADSFWENEPDEISPPWAWPWWY